MKFVRIPGLPGKVYQPPGTAAGQGKHPCPDCFACQHCDDTRCQACGPPEEEAPPESPRGGGEDPPTPDPPTD